jgi:TrmH family RNA methyltransferase
VEGTAENRLVADFRTAAASAQRVRLDGFHALKHALRFGAEVETVLSSDPAGLEELARELAPDVGERLAALTTEVAAETFAKLGPYAHHTGVVAIARRPGFDAPAALARADAPAILLEDPRHLGNLGAVVRVAAAADCAGVLTTGEQDPWDPVAIRGSGGLHFALPVGRIDGGPAGDAVATLDRAGRRLYAIDPEGDDVDPRALSPDAIYAFGSERHGLSAATVAAADHHLRIPMRAGVSSLNLATSVAAILFAWRLA